MLHAGLAMSSVTHPFEGAPATSVFPRYSAQVVKETLAVISLVLLAAAFVMLVTLLAPELLGRAAGSVACSTLDQWSLLSPWCSALI